MNLDLFQNCLFDIANLFFPLFDFKINSCSGLAKFVYIVCTVLVEHCTLYVNTPCSVEQ